MDVHATTAARAAGPPPAAATATARRRSDAGRSAPPERAQAHGDGLPLPEGEVTFRARVADLLHAHSEVGARRAGWSSERARLHVDSLHYELLAERWRRQLASGRDPVTVVDV